MTTSSRFVRAAPSGVALRRIRITPEASVAIDSWAWGVVDGSMQLVELPAAVQTFYTVAYESGRRSRDDEIRALRVERDRYWLLAFGEKERRQFLLDRLDRAAELADRPDVDDVLDEAWQIYLASLDNLREPVRLPAPTTEDRKEVA
ncbi:hypothetical protein ABE10_11025 [Bacillus toyonensis]|nr:hypothetical protein [Bacillus toyonensis]